MPVGAFVPSRIHLDYPEWQAPLIGNIGQVWAYDGTGYAPVALDFDPAGTAAAAIVTHVGLADPHTGYLLADGTRAGASSQAQTFTSGIVTGSMQPVTDSTTAIRCFAADGSTVFITGDTTNRRLIITSGPAASSTESQAQLRVYDGTRVRAAMMFTAAEGLLRVVGPDGTRSFTASATNSAVRFFSSHDFQVLAGGSSNSTSVGAVNGGYELNVSASTATFRSGANNAVRVIVRGVATQSVDLMQWQNSSSTVLSSVSALGHFDIAASTTARASLRVRAGTAPTTPKAGEVWYPTGGRLNVYRAATETIASGVPGSGGAATATGTWGATEQDMLQKCYDIVRAFGMLS